MARGRLGRRIALISLGLLLLIQAASFGVIQRSIKDSARAQTSAELDVGERVLKKTLDARALRLLESAKGLARDYRLRQALDLKNQQALESVLEGAGVSMGASIALYTGADFSLRAGVGQDADAVFNRIRTRYKAWGAMESAKTLNVGGRLYQLVIAPVIEDASASKIEGWVALGFPVESSELADFKDTSKLEAALAVKSEERRWAITAVAMNSEVARELGEALAVGGPQALESGSAKLSGSDYAARWVSLGREGEEQEQLGAALLRSVDQAMEPYARLQWTLLGITALGVMVFGAASAWAARRVTRPLAELALAVEGLERGDYDVRMELTGKDEVGEVARAFSRMRSSLQEREAQALRLAYWDELTGLPNRERFKEELAARIESAKAKGASVCVLMLDLDRLKNVNDLLGQAFGDQLLERTARRLEGLARVHGGGERLAARLGGDKFVMLLSEGGLEHGQELALAAQRAFQKPLVIKDQTIDLGAGIGLAAYPEHADSAETLMSRAEMAMYAAKERKALIVSYESALDSGSQASLSLLSELRLAIEKNQLRLFLQPKISLATGKVVGAEALARWEHPQRGLLAPFHFIPFAEQTGFIKNISRWMIERSAQALARIQKVGPDWKMSVNLSTRDLLDEQLGAYVKDRLETAGARASGLCLEITESSLMENPEMALSTLEELRAMGASLSIDDFGTGYSSLAYLRRMPLDELKIDRSFVMGLDAPSAQDQIVRSTIELAHNLGLYVVAEGVETESAAVTLKKLGCDQAQGYWLAKPMPEEDFVSWALRWRPPASLLAPASAQPLLPDD